MDILAPAHQHINSITQEALYPYMIPIMINHI